MKIHLVPKKSTESPTTDADACPLCASKYHESQHCPIRRSTAPVRRNWGYPGWENETAERRAAFEASRDPSKKGT